MTCKDCKYYNEDYKLFPPYAKCDKHSGNIVYLQMADDDICHEFEPKEDSWERESVNE